MTGAALGGLAVIWASLQLVLSKRRDLGPMTIGLVTCALVASGPADRQLVAVLAVIAATIGCIGWVCGARFGVGRLALDGLVGLLSLVVGLTPMLLGAFEVPIGARLGPLVVASGVATALALERAGAAKSGPAWYRRVPISVRNAKGQWEEIRG